MKETIMSDFIKLLVINLGTMYLNFKVLNMQETYKKKILVLIGFQIVINILCIVIKNLSNYTASIISLNVLLAILLAKITKNKFGYSVLINTLTLSISHIICTLSIILCFVILKMANFSKQASIPIIIVIYFLFLFIISRIRKIKHGIAFLINNKDNEYFEILILNISATIFFCFIMISNLNIELIRSLFIYMVIFSGIMFITIQKSLQLYYKQRMLVKDLEETKEELENKKKEIAK